MIANVTALLSAARQDPLYLGDPHVVEACEWKVGPDGETEFLVPRDSVSTAALQPAVLKAIVQIQKQGFFATPDCKFNPNKMADWLKPLGPVAAFRRGDMSFIVGPVMEDKFPLLHAEYQQVYNSLDTIRRNVMPRVSQIGCCTGENMEFRLKISHSVFEPRPTNLCRPKENDKANEDVGGPEPAEKELKDLVDTPAKWESLDHDVDYPYRIASLLPVVSPCCLPLLRQIIPTTRFNPLPAVLEHNQSSAIMPAHYQSVLCGAIVELSFTFSHKFVKRPGGKVSFFKATLDNLVVLETPATINETPSKEKNKRLFSSHDGPNDQSSAKKPEAEPSGSKAPKRARKA